VRPLFALFISLLIFGAVAGYLRFSQEVRSALAQRESGKVEEVAAEDVFTLEITLTFDAGGESAFSLEPAESTAVLVRFRDRELLRMEEPVPAGTPLRIEEIEGVVEGSNEFYIEAHPASQAIPVAHAVRVRVFRNQAPVAEETLWSEPGLPVRGTVRFDVRTGADDHEH
jgi:hypothetical protein